MELKDLKRLVAFCRSAGVISYESGQVKFTLSLNDPKEDKRTVRKLQKVEKTVEEKLAEMSEEDLLLYSSASFKDTEV